jgi:peptidoglycan/xylan/chitin deacetylase (PgdA/CDA1 family)
VRVLVARGLELALRLSSRRAGLVVVYHAVAERPADLERDVSPAHDAALFEAQLRHLVACYEIVPADRMLDAVASRERGRRFPVAVTFDDDLPTHALVALPLLRELDIPATFFLCGASLERPHAFWWERLQVAVDHDLDLAAISEGATTPQALALRIEETTPDDRTRLAERLGALVGADPPESGMRAADVRTLAEAGLEIGFHTLRHDRLPPLDDASLASALRDGRAELGAAAGQAVDVIAYPHGRADERVALAARDSGFRLGFTGTQEAITERSDPLRLSRIEPPFTDVAAFAGQLVRALRGAHR